MTANFNFPDTRPDHNLCRPALVKSMADEDIEITVSDQPPLIANAYTIDPFICPHGTSYWMEPTSEQIAAWARDKVE